MYKADPTYNHGEILMIHHQVFRELQLSLNRFINTEVSKSSAKMVGEWCNYVNKQIPEKDALIKRLQTENRNLQLELTTCNSKLRAHKEQIAAQQTHLTIKTERIGILEKETSDADRIIESQKCNIMTLKSQRMQQLRAKDKAIADFKQLSLKFAEVKQENDRLKFENSFLSSHLKTAKDVEEKLKEANKMKDHYHSIYLTEIKEKEKLMAEMTEKDFEILVLKQKQNPEPKSKVQTKKNFLNEDEYKMILNEKDLEIKEYLKIINEKDSQSSQTSCCPVCMTDIGENKQWIAFHPCGHQTCSECFDDLPLTAQNTKFCPICNTVISVSVPLADI